MHDGGLESARATASAARTTDYDVIVIGCGIVGLAVAAELMQRQPTLRLLMLEKEAGVAAHQTGHNSGVIHSGVYYAPGSLKAKLCVEGAELMVAYCERAGVPYERCGKLIVARDDGEVARLRDLFHRARENRVPGVRWLEGDEITEVEPGCVGVAAVHSPHTGIVDYAEVSRSLAADLEAAGVEFRFATPVRRVTPEIVDSGVTTPGPTTPGTTAPGPTAPGPTAPGPPNVTVVELANGTTVTAGYAIACAGLWSDQLAAASGAGNDPRILPFRGAYLHLDLQGADAREVVRGMVYPVPNPELPFLGVHITRHIDGSVSLGPTAMITFARDGYGDWNFRWSDVWSIASWPGSWRVLGRFWKTAFSELRFRFSRTAFLAACAEFMPELAYAKLKRRGSAGVRAQAVARDGSMADDFVISESSGAAHVRNAPSPAATSSFAIAKYVADRLEPQLGFSSGE